MHPKRPSKQATTKQRTKFLVHTPRHADLLGPCWSLRAHGRSFLVFGRFLACCTMLFIQWLLGCLLTSSKCFRATHCCWHHTWRPRYLHDSIVRFNSFQTAFESLPDLNLPNSHAQRLGDSRRFRTFTFSNHPLVYEPPTSAWQNSWWPSVQGLLGSFYGLILTFTFSKWKTLVPLWIKPREPENYPRPHSPTCKKKGEQPGLSANAIKAIHKYKSLGLQTTPRPSLHPSAQVFCLKIDPPWRGSDKPG